jgi:hypothetical protein
MICEVLEKAKDYSKLVPEKITRADGSIATYWVSPEDRNEGKLKGQQNLFKDDAPKTDGRGYFDELDKGAEDLQIKPLVSKVAAYDPELAKRLEAKYKNYHFDRDTKEKDIEVDFQTAWCLKRMADRPEEAKDFLEEYHAKTDKMVALLNNRKNAMLKIKKGTPVRVGHEKGIVDGFSKRGFPMVRVGTTSRPLFHEELTL